MTPAEKKALRRAEEVVNKPRCCIVSNHGTASWVRRQEALRLWGYRSKISCAGKPDRHLLGFVDPDRGVNRSNGYNIARVHGVADLASADGCTCAALVTLTLPGRMHSGFKGHPNPAWDGSTPLDGREYLAVVARNIRGGFKRLFRVLGYRPWFYRATEAHKDGTPHQHWVIFFRPGDDLVVCQAIDRAYKAEGRHHGRRRIKFENCRHFEGAQSYARKYVTKNTKGLSPGFKKQRVWRCIWGIRAFGTSLGLRAGVYNLLRRFQLPGVGGDCPAELAVGVRLARANKMAEASLWADGAGLSLVYEDRVSHRGDPYKALVGMVQAGSGEAWFKPRWVVGDVFRFVRYGDGSRAVYNSLAHEEFDNGRFGRSLRVRPDDGGFEELPSEFHRDIHQERYEWGDNTDDSDDTG